MEVNERILKLQLGGRANSRRDLNEAEAAYKTALAAMDSEDAVSKDRQALAVAYLTSVGNMSSANPATNKRERHRSAEAYRIATKMLTGEYNNAEVVNPYTGGGSRSGGYADSDRTALEFMMKNQGQLQVQPAQSTTLNTGSSDTFRFNWKKGLNSISAPLNTTFQLRIKDYASALYNNINEAVESGKRIIGGVQGMGDFREELQNIINGADSNPDAAYNSLLNIAGNFDQDGSHWDNWFGDYIPKESESDKRHNDLISNHYLDVDLSQMSKWIQRTAEEKGLKFMKDANGNTRAFNKDWSEYTGDKFTLHNDDWNDENVENGGYGHVMMSDKDGNWFLGDASTIGENSTFNPLYQEYLKNSIASRKNLHREWDLNDELDTSDNPYFQSLQLKFGYNIKGSDVSGLFSGDDRIFAMDPSGIAFTEDKYGNARFKDTAKFYKVDDQGNVTETSWSELSPSYRRSGWGEGDYQMGLAVDLNTQLEENAGDQLYYNDDMDLYGRNFGDALLLSYGIPVEGATIVATQLFGAAGRQGIKKAAEEAAIKLALKKLTGKALENAARKIATEKLLEELGKGTLKKALLRGGVKLGAKFGVQSALTLGGLGSFGLSTAIGAGLALGEAGIRYNSWDNINEDPTAFVRNILGAVGNGGNGELKVKSKDGSVTTNAQFLKNIKYDEHKDELTEFLYNYLKANPSIKLSDTEKAYWRKMRLEYNKRMAERKQRGLIEYAAKGTVLTVTGEELEPLPFESDETEKANKSYDKLRKKYLDAENKGYGNDIARMDASEAKMFSGNFQMSFADSLRIATLAQDAASIVASFVPGAGTGVAAGLGVTSMGTDLIADLMDPAVSGGEVAKNLAMNAGFAGLGLIPGAKMGKVVKNLVKWTPKIMTAVAGLGIAMDESTLNTFKKLGDGTLKLNREDWRNISHVLSLIAAGTRGVKGDIAKMKVKKGIVASDNVTLKGLETPDGKPLQFQKETIKEVNKALGEIKTSEEGAQAKAVTILKEKLLLTDELAAAVLNTPKFEKIKGGIGKYSIDEITTLDSGKSYDNLRAIWNEEAKTVDQSSKAGNWFANKLGGGNYTAKQRAILEIANEQMNGVNAAKLMRYKESYNPMIDFLNLRGKSGSTRMSARPIDHSEELAAIKGMSAEALAAARSNSAKEILDKKAEADEAAGVNAALQHQKEIEARIEANKKVLEGQGSKLALLDLTIKDLDDLNNKLILDEIELKKLTGTPEVDRLLNIENTKNSISTTKDSLNKADENLKLLADLQAKASEKVKLATQRVEDATIGLDEAKAIKGRGAKNKIADAEKELRLAKRSLSDAIRKEKNASDKLLTEQSSRDNIYRQLNGDDEAGIQGLTSKLKELEEIEQRIISLREGIASKRSSEIPALEALKARLENELLQETDLLLQNEAALGTAKSDVEAKRTIARGMYDKIREAILGKGNDLEGILPINMTLKTEAGTSVKAKSGATFTSYEHLNNRGTENIVRKTKEPKLPTGYLKLRVESLKKLLPGLQDINGAAYNAADNKFIIWQNGGQINYNKLRK